MAKLEIIFAVLVALLALAEASRYTVVTNVEEDNQEGQLSERCTRQMKEQHWGLDYCAAHLTQGSPYDMAMNQQRSRYLKECCRGLQNINEQQCRCQGISESLTRLQAVTRQAGGGSWGDQRRQEIMTKAKFLPRMCNLGHECDIQISVF